MAPKIKGVEQRDQLVIRPILPLKKRTTKEKRGFRKRKTMGSTTDQACLRVRRRSRVGASTLGAGPTTSEKKEKDIGGRKNGVHWALVIRHRGKKRHLARWKTGEGNTREKACKKEKLLLGLTHVAGAWGRSTKKIIAEPASGRERSCKKHPHFSTGRETRGTPIWKKHKLPQLPAQCGPRVKWSKFDNPMGGNGKNKNRWPSLLRKGQKGWGIK